MWPTNQIFSPHKLVSLIGVLALNVNSFTPMFLGFCGATHCGKSTRFSETSTGEKGRTLSQYVHIHQIYAGKRDPRITHSNWKYTQKDEEREKHKIQIWHVIVQLCILLNLTRGSRSFNVSCCVCSILLQTTGTNISSKTELPVTELCVDCQLRLPRTRFAMSSHAYKAKGYLRPEGLKWSTNQTRETTDFPIS